MLALIAAASAVGAVNHRRCSCATLAMNKIIAANVG